MKSLMKQEDDQLIKNFLSKTFFEGWKKENKCNPLFSNYQALELQVNASCDLKCKYCYYARFKEHLYPAKIAKHSITMKNLNIVLDWLVEQDYHPNIELFSGELFMQEIGFEVVERVIDWRKENNMQCGIVIPTNFTFIGDAEKTKRVEYLMNKAEGNLRLSASVDGKYCDANRPFATGKEIRDDDYYERVFAFAKKHLVAFHPMIYSENIEKWKDNWLWFQENLKKHDISFSAIYLLEVRNAEWSIKQLKDFYDFTRFVVNWSWNHVKEFVSPDKFPNFVFDKKLFNLFSMFGTIGRGLGCSAESTVQLRLGDLTTSVCHRASYKPHNLWRFVTENDKIVDIESLNHNLTLAFSSFDFRAAPYCCYCAIRDMCNGQCLGSMYETNGDPFMPIPTVCALEHTKFAAMMDELKYLGLFKHFYNFANPDKQRAMKIYDKLFARGEVNEI